MGGARSNDDFQQVRGRRVEATLSVEARRFGIAALKTEDRLQPLDLVENAADYQLGRARGGV